MLVGQPCSLITWNPSTSGDSSPGYRCDHRGRPLGGWLVAGVVSVLLQPSPQTTGLCELRTEHLPLRRVEDRPQLGLGQPGGSVEHEPVVVPAESLGWSPPSEE